MTKELLSEVYNEKVFKSEPTTPTILRMYYDEKFLPQEYIDINIHELTSKMKEWICDMEQLQGICTHKAYVCSTDDSEWYSGYLLIKTTYSDEVREEIKGKGDTEFDAVKEHCEWILEQKAKA